MADISLDLIYFETVVIIFTYFAYHFLHLPERGDLIVIHRDPSRYINKSKKFHLSSDLH